MAPSKSTIMALSTYSLALGRRVAAMSICETDGGGSRYTSNEIIFIEWVTDGEKAAAQRR